MSRVTPGDMSDLMVARRLMQAETRLRQSAKAGRRARGRARTALDDFREDQALVGGGGPAAVAGRPARAGEEEVRVNLRALNQRLKSGEREPAANAPRAQVAEVYLARRERVEVSIEMRVLERVEGLVKTGAQSAETDRYEFNFLNGTQFTIKDKWTGKSTRVWSDPYVDVSDVAGDVNGDFKDLTGSLTHTTFDLQDGTSVIFTARDDGVIEQVDVVKGGQHLRGWGAGAPDFEARPFFAGPVGAAAEAAGTPRGDVVVAGGDGNDWYDAAGRLVWGQWTSPPPIYRPAYTVEIKQRTVVEEVAAVRLVDTAG